MSDEINLEVELENRAKDDKVAEGLWHRYMMMKAFLRREYYPWIQASCPYYTDHGQHHIESVIKTASLLVGKFNLLIHLDIFLILSAIIWHDAGMVYGRTGHQNQVGRMLQNIQQLAFIDVTIKRLIEDIVKAHSGEGGLAIPQRDQDCTLNGSTFTVYPRALAAVVRFADEVSENRSRVSESIRPQLHEDNLILWDYASCISAARPEPARQRVVVSVELHDGASITKYRCPTEFCSYADGDGKICMVQYVICRLQKMNRERAYCNPEFRKYSEMREITVRMMVIKAGCRVEGYEQEFVFGDNGLVQQRYPNINIYDDFFQRFPDWQPDRIREVLS